MNISVGPNSPWACSLFHLEQLFSLQFNYLDFYILGIEEENLLLGLNNSVNISVDPNSPRVLQFVPPLTSYGHVEDETYLVSLRSLEAKVCFLVSLLVKISVVFRIRIRRMHMFLGFPDPHPDPLVTRIRILPSSSTNSKKNLDFYCFVTSLRLFTGVSDSHPYPYVFRPPGSASGSVRQRYGSEDPDPHPDLYQNFTDPQHW